MRRSVKPARLHEAVEALHGSRCPCCDKIMVRHRRSQTRWRVPRDHPTVAHDVATGCGGNPDVWVYTCLACNAAQGILSFEEWARHLAYYGDKRAERVDKLARFIIQWCEERDIPRRIGKKDRRPVAWHSLA